MLLVPFLGELAKAWSTHTDGVPRVQPHPAGEVPSTPRTAYCAPVQSAATRTPSAEWCFCQYLCLPRHISLIRRSGIPALNCDSWCMTVTCGKYCVRHPARRKRRDRSVSSE